MITCPGAIAFLHVAYFTTSFSNKGFCNGTGGIQCSSNFYQVGNACRECPPGFHGWNCSQPCPEKYYGPTCHRQCKCSKEECDSRIGCANLTECPSGFHGWNCSQPCPGKYYWPSCHRQCKCSKEECDSRIGCANLTVSTLYDAEHTRYAQTSGYKDTPGHASDAMLSTRTLVILLGTVTSLVLAFAIILELRKYFHDPAHSGQLTGDVYAELDELCIDENNATPPGSNPNNC